VGEAARAVAACRRSYAPERAASAHVAHGPARRAEDPDALAIIVPRAGREADTGRWGWFVYGDGDYRELGDAERAGRVEMTAPAADFVVIGEVEEAA
jgi:hypothetical protein